MCIFLKVVYLLSGYNGNGLRSEWWSFIYSRCNDSNWSKSQLLDSSLLQISWLLLLSSIFYWMQFLIAFI